MIIITRVCDHCDGDDYKAGDYDDEHDDDNVD
jgi:hypothetical protein